jgi:hypothetical protein
VECEGTLDVRVVDIPVHGGNGANAGGDGNWVWVVGSPVGYGSGGWRGKRPGLPPGRLVVCGGWGNMVGAHAVWVRAHPSACVDIDQWVCSLGFARENSVGSLLWFGVDGRVNSAGFGWFRVGVVSSRGGVVPWRANLRKVLGLRVSKWGPGV